MNWDQVEGKWKQMKGSVKQKWGRLTDDDLDVIGGKRDQLVGKIQERYGMTKEDAHREVESWDFPAAGTDSIDERDRKLVDSNYDRKAS
jgi:uncharacterized protein YjbJ (UPF0337 family)